MLTEMYPNVEMVLLKFKENPQPGKKNPITYIEYVPDVIYENSKDVNSTPFVEASKQTKTSLIVLLDSVSSAPSPYHRCTFTLTGVKDRDVYLAELIKEEKDDVEVYINKSRLYIEVNGKIKFSAYYSNIASLQLRSYLAASLGNESTRTIFLGEPFSKDDIEAMAKNILDKLSKQKSMVRTPLSKFVDA